MTGEPAGDIARAVTRARRAALRNGEPGLSSTCPTCDAKPGEGCRDGTGRLRSSSHASRVQRRDQARLFA